MKHKRCKMAFCSKEPTEGGQYCYTHYQYQRAKPSDGPVIFEVEDAKCDKCEKPVSKHKFYANSARTVGCPPGDGDDAISPDRKALLRALKETL